jgi:hypothetical protein
VVSTIAAIWLLSGVTVGEAARFVVFEALYVVLPGCLLYLVLISHPGGRLRVLAIGWPLGYVVEVGAFALSAALHARTAFTFLPLISIILAAASAVRGSRRELWGAHGAGRRLDRAAQRPPAASIEPVLVALAICAVLVMLALTSFTLAPLPGHFHSVAYPEEYLYAISVAAEAAHHWPITTPWVAGLPLRYYTAVFIHGAAINQVTRVALPTIYMRLFPMTATLVLALQLWSLGRAMMRSRLAGLLAIILYFLVGAATLTPGRAWPLEGTSLWTFWVSTTFTFGALFFLGLLSLVQHWLSDGIWATARARAEGTARLRRDDIGVLLLLAVLVLGCGSAKMFAAVDFVGGLGLFWIWSLITRKACRLLPYMLTVAIACVATTYFTMLAGGGAKNLGIQPLNAAFFDQWPGRAADLAQAVGAHSVFRSVLLIGAVILIAICLLAPVLGAVWLLSRCRPLSAFQLFCSAVVLVGVVGYYLTFGHAYGAELYFRGFGYFALVLLAAGGLANLVTNTPKDAWRAVGGTCGVVLVLALVIAASLFEAPFVRHTEVAWDAAMYGLVAVVVAFSARKLQKYYAPVILSRSGAMLACCIPIVGVLGFVRPLENTALGAKAVIFDQALGAKVSPSTWGVNVPLYQGLEWVRTHTRACDVLAVNNHHDGPSNGYFSAPLYYSAFTERRFFLESWGYTPGGIGGGQPFPEKLALNDNAVVHGNAVALRDLAHDGVSYVLVDKTHGGGAQEPQNVSRLVFSNSALDVYHLSAQASAVRPRLGCGRRF